MTSERAHTKTQVSKRSVTRSLHTFSMDNTNFLDEKEDACMQTCMCATERSTPAQQTPSADSAYEEIKVCNKFLLPARCVILQKFTISCNKV